MMSVTLIGPDKARSIVQTAEETTVRDVATSKYGLFRRITKCNGITVDPFTTEVAAGDTVTVESERVIAKNHFPIQGGVMTDKTNKPVFVYVATYSTLDDAKADYGEVKSLYFDGVIGVFDAAVVSKDATGQVKIHKTEMPTQYGAWGGLAVGALVGIFFPPYLVWELAAGAAAGSLIGHFWAGMSRSDLKEIGDTLQASTATLIVVGRSRLQETLQRVTKRAVKQFEKQLDTDIQDFDKALTKAVNQSLKAA